MVSGKCCVVAQWGFDGGVRLAGDSYSDRPLVWEWKPVCARRRWLWER